MEKMKVSAPAKIQRRGYWLIALIAIILMGVASWIQQQSYQSIWMDRNRFELQRRADEAARITADMREAFQLEMIALAEQRGLRQGMMDWSDRKVSRDFFAGFKRALDASCRAIAAGGPGIKNLSLRDLEGKKIAGSGADAIRIDFPDIMERIRIKASTTDKGDYAETLVIPVRDVAATPIAFLYAEVNPSGYGKALMRLMTIGEDDLLFMLTSTGRQIWISDEDANVSNLGTEVSQTIVDGVTYDLVHAEIRETDWMLYLANCCDETERTFIKANRITALMIFAAALILSITVLLITRERQRP